MSAPTVFISAATDDLESLRNVLHGAFSRAHFRVFTQSRSLGASSGTLRDHLVHHINESDAVIHLAGMAYGADAGTPFPDALTFQCSWTQFEYYYAHRQAKTVIGFACAPGLSRKDFEESGPDDADIARRQRLQQAHWERVASGEFRGTPLDGFVKRALNERVESMDDLIQAVAASVSSLLERLAPGARLNIQPSLHTIPPPPAAFVGRESDLAALRGINPASGALITSLRGMGGIGKTALALVLAHEWTPRFPDAQLLLDARGTQPDPPSARRLMEQVIQTFRPFVLLPDDYAAVKGLYHDVLRGKKVLLLVDNACDAAQAEPLIPPVGCALIVTSRQNFLLGTTRAHTLGKLPDDQGAALLREYYPELTGDEARRLMRLCAGLPLALKLAGAHFALEAVERDGPADVAGFIRQLETRRLARLDADAADANEVGVSESLRLSESQLSVDWREAWRRLGIFTASFDARAGLAIAGADEIMLAQYVRRSLLEREGNDRYKLHDLAADYARMQFAEDALDTLALTHARHYAAVGQEIDSSYLGNLLAGLALFDREHSQLDAAFAWLAEEAAIPGPVQQDAAIVLLDLVQWTDKTSRARFHPGQTITWWEAALAAARRLGRRDAEGFSLINVGRAYERSGNFRKAIKLNEEGLDVFRKIGHREGESRCLDQLGDDYASLGELGKSIEFHEKALATAREAGLRDPEMGALRGLGHAYWKLGQVHNAVTFYEQFLLIARDIGDLRAETAGLGNLGNMYRELGNPHKAIEFHEQARAIAHEIGDRRLEGVISGNLGLVWKSVGALDKSIALQEEGLEIDRELGDRHGIGVRLTGLAHAYSAKGEVERAKALYAESASVLAEIDDKLDRAHALYSLATTNRKCADDVQALELMEQARALYAACDSPNAIDAEGYLAEWSGDMRKMVAHNEKALSVARESGDRVDECNRLINLGDAYQKLGDSARFGRYTEAALVIACETNDRSNEGICLHNLGEYQLGLGNLQESRGYYTQALAIAGELDFRLLDANSRWGLAQIERRKGDVTDAAALADAALTIYDAIDAKTEAERVRTELALWRSAEAAAT